jgi:hypothetical protein
MRTTCHRTRSGWSGLRSGLAPLTVRRLLTVSAMVVFCGVKLCTSTEVSGPEDSFPKPGDRINNHIHANVHFDARKSSTFSLVSKKEAYQQDSTMVASYADRSYLKFLSVFINIFMHACKRVCARDWAIALVNVSQDIYTYIYVYICIYIYIYVYVYVFAYIYMKFLSVSRERERERERDSARLSW